MDLDAELVQLLDRSIIGPKAFQLIEAGADPNCLSSSGFSLLHLLIFNRLYSSVISLVKRFKANINVRDRRGNPPVYYMMEDKYPINDIQEMIKLGADPRTTNKEGIAVINLLIQSDFAFVLSLVEKDTSLLQFSDSFGSLIQHMLNLRHECHFTPDEWIGLVRNGADPYVCDKNGNSLLSVINHDGNEFQVKEFVILSKMSPDDRKLYTCRLIGYYIYNDYSLLISHLNSNDLSSAEIAIVARFPFGKEMLIQYIKTLDIIPQLEIIERCLNEKTKLYEFFSVQRGWFMTSSNRGTLGELKALQNKLKNQLANINTKYGEEMCSIEKTCEY